MVHRDGAGHGDLHAGSLTAPACPRPVVALASFVHPVLVVGGGLAGLAAALRLAKAGHPVQLWEATERLGGRYAATTDERRLVDTAPAVIGFPAPWRDLFRKSGRTLEAELARTGAALVAADPARYEFADGSELDLPTDRGDQFVALSRAYGPRPAEHWRDLLDWLDDVWQAVRPLGLEAELTDPAQLTAAVRPLLQPRLTVASLAERMPHPDLAALIRASAYRMGSLPRANAGLGGGGTVGRTPLRSLDGDGARPRMPEPGPVGPRR